MLIAAEISAKKCPKIWVYLARLTFFSGNSRKHAVLFIPGNLCKFISDFFIRWKASLPWVPEVFLARFPVSGMTLL